MNIIDWRRGLERREWDTLSLLLDLVSYGLDFSHICSTFHFICKFFFLNILGEDLYLICKFFFVFAVYPWPAGCWKSPA
jgi:hypothetical protein